MSAQDISDLCASFEHAIAETVVDRTAHAMDLYIQECGDAAERLLVVAGGVAANTALRTALSELCEKKRFSLRAPPVKLCTDNAAMIAWAGAERLARGWSDPLDVAAQARWPLDPSAPAAAGAGVKA